MTMVVFIDNAPSTAEYPEIVAIHEHTTGFLLAASAMADECFLHHYLGVYYNIPACSKQTPWNPPFYCVTHGNVVGVLPSWEHTLNAILGVCNANYEEVDTIAISEEKVRLAIEKGEVEIGGIKAFRWHILHASQSDSHLESDAFSEGAGDEADFGYMDGYMDAIDDVPATSKRKQTTADNPLLQCFGWMAEGTILRILAANVALIPPCSDATTVVTCSYTAETALSTTICGVPLIASSYITQEARSEDPAGAHNWRKLYPALQLLRMGWFPSTTVYPRTAATFRLLHHYQILSFESKASTYEFYHSLVRISDNVGLIKKDRYESFMCMVLSASGTKEGECAVLCPACPQPGKNLPPDWKEAPKAKQYINMDYLFSPHSTTAISTF
ncbi:hypothetical protein DFH29DRAFT_880765 [Suillus ampliporus]|nr:hypothetical protein DFH29DRAFT_880765 [Suillus ampliporus]